MSAALAEAPVVRDDPWRAREHADHVPLHLVASARADQEEADEQPAVEKVAREEAARDVQLVIVRLAVRRGRIAVALLLVVGHLLAVALIIACIARNADS